MTSPDTPLRLPPLPRILSAYGLGLGMATLLSSLYAYARYGAPAWPGLALGWGVAAAAAAAGLAVKRIALSGDLTRFFLWGLAVNGGRAAAILLIIVAAHRCGMAAFRPFVIAVFSGYFSCMVSEITILHSMTIRGVETA